MLLFYAGNVLFRFAALALIPLSIVAPSSALTIAFNAGFAWYYFKERLTILGWFGTALIIAGCAVAVIVGNQSEESRTLDELLDLFTTQGFIIFAAVSGGIFVLFCIYAIYFHCVTVPRTIEAFGLTVAVAAAGDAAAISTAPVDGKLTYADPGFVEAGADADDLKGGPAGALPPPIALGSSPHMSPKLDRPRSLGGGDGSSGTGSPAGGSPGGSPILAGGPRSSDAMISPTAAAASSSGRNHDGFMPLHASTLTTTRMSTTFTLPQTHPIDGVDGRSNASRSPSSAASAAAADAATGGLGDIPLASGSGLNSRDSSAVAAVVPLPLPDPSVPPTPGAAGLGGQGMSASFAYGLGASQPSAAASAAAGGGAGGRAARGSAAPSPAYYTRRATPPVGSSPALRPLSGGLMGSSLGAPAPASGAQTSVAIVVHASPALSTRQTRSLSFVDYVEDFIFQLPPSADVLPSSACVGPKVSPALGPTPLSLSGAGAGTGTGTPGLNQSSVGQQGRASPATGARGGLAPSGSFQLTPGGPQRSLTGTASAAGGGSVTSSPPGSGAPGSGLPPRGPQRSLSGFSGRNRSGSEAFDPSSRSPAHSHSAHGPAQAHTPLHPSSRATGPSTGATASGAGVAGPRAARRLQLPADSAAGQEEFKGDDSTTAASATAATLLEAANQPDVVNTAAPRAAGRAQGKKGKKGKHVTFGPCVIGSAEDGGDNGNGNGGDDDCDDPASLAPGKSNNSNSTRGGKGSSRHARARRAAVAAAYRGGAWDSEDEDEDDDDDDEDEDGGGSTKASRARARARGSGESSYSDRDDGEDEDDGDEGEDGEREEGMSASLAATAASGAVVVRVGNDDEFHAAADGYDAVYGNGTGAGADGAEGERALVLAEADAAASDADIAADAAAAAGENDADAGEGTVVDPEAEAAAALKQEQQALLPAAFAATQLSPAPHAALAIGMAYLPAITASYMNLTAKSAMALIKATFKGDNYFKNFATYLILIGLIASTLITLRLVSQMMKLFPAMLIVPIYQCLFIVGLILVSAFYFGDFSNLSNVNLGIFLGSIFLCFVGIFILTQQSGKAAAVAAATRAAELEAEAAAKAAAQAAEAAELEGANKKSHMADDTADADAAAAGAGEEEDEEEYDIEAGLGRSASATATAAKRNGMRRSSESVLTGKSNVELATYGATASV